MGKSLSKKLEKVGGQHPIEPAKCGCKIYHGPHISNFKEIYSLLNEMKISYEVNNEQDLSNMLMGDYKNFSVFNKYAGIKSTQWIKKASSIAFSTNSNFVNVAI